MEYDQLLKIRQSTRKFTDRQISDEQISTILDAANHAPVGSGLYKDLHIAVVQDRNLLKKFCEAAWKRFSTRDDVKTIAGDTVREDIHADSKPDLFYGAPTVFFIAHRRQSVQPGIEWANVATVANQMHLAATNLELGSCYMWGALESMRLFPELDHTDLLQLPEGFVPLLGLAVGYPKQKLAHNLRQHEQIKVNFIIQEEV